MNWRAARRIEQRTMDGALAGAVIRWCGGALTPRSEQERPAPTAEVIPMSPTHDTASIAASYEAVAYDARPNYFSHPDHIAAIATMFGLEAPEADRARVLEVGCNDGANLLPLAATLPQSSLLGCDLAAAAIQRAREATATLSLGNVEWFAGDFRELPPAREPFDYIIAHGVYSWVPAPVRDALFALAKRTLAPNGLLF